MTLFPIARTIASSLGVIYLGSQTSMRKVDGDVVDVIVHTFREPSSGSTIALFDDELTTTRLTEKVLASRAAFSCNR